MTIPHGRYGHICSTLCGAANPHTCTNPNCDAWVDADHKEPVLCIVCKERPAEPYSETCSSSRCEKFLAEYDLGIL